MFHSKRSLQGAQNLTAIQPLSEPGVNAESRVISRPKGQLFVESQKAKIFDFKGQIDFMARLCVPLAPTRRW